MPRTLRIDFTTTEEFQREYKSNLANGGVFIETSDVYELRECVDVELVPAFSDEQRILKGEVVHIVLPEMATAGGRPGVAIQFSATAAEVTMLLEPLLIACNVDVAEVRVDPGQRAAPRVVARVPALIKGEDAAVQGMTRNLSLTGVLVATPKGGVSVGDRVQVTLEHPTTGESMEVAGTVAREIESEGDAAVGIQFDLAQENKAEVEKFLESVQNFEHSRQLGGITGAIEALGPQSLLQMFGNVSKTGTLVLRNGEAEGMIGFENKLLRYAVLGNATGMKALVRLMSWRSGHFEFHASFEPIAEMEGPLPLEAALFEATRELDEAARMDSDRLPMDSTVAVMLGDDPSHPGEETLTKIEQAVVDLSRAGFTVSHIIDVIPECDSEILYALSSLTERGFLRVEG